MPDQDRSKQTAPTSNQNRLSATPRIKSKPFITMQNSLATKYGATCRSQTANEIDDSNTSRLKEKEKDEEGVYWRQKRKNSNYKKKKEGIMGGTWDVVEVRGRRRRRWEGEGL